MFPSVIISVIVPPGSKAFFRRWRGLIVQKVFNNYLQKIKAMKKVIIPGLVSSLILLGFSFLCLFLTIRVFPDLAEEFYNPIFWPGNDRAILFFLHPFILSFALAWFWNRAKGRYTGSAFQRGLQLGGVYCLIASVPAMWITFSAMSVTLPMVLSWVIYGFCQATIAGIVFARMNP